MINFNLKKFYKFFLTTFFIFLISLILIELIGPYILKKYLPYNLVPQKIKIDFFEKSNLTEFTIKKNYNTEFKISSLNINEEINTNEIGRENYNNENIPKTKHKSIYLFGDSFIFGWGVGDDYTLPSFIQKNTNKFKFVNMGYTSGRDLSSYYTWIKDQNKNNNEKLNLIIFFWKNDLEDFRGNKCYDKDNIIVLFSSEACVNTKSDIGIYDGNLYSKNTNIIRLISPFYYYLKQSYTISLTRFFYSKIKDRKNKKNNKKEKSIYANTLSPIEYKELYSMLKYINNSSNLLSIILLDYNKKNNFYNSIRDIGEELNVKVKSIKPLDQKYRFSLDDPHYRKEGNKIIAEKIHINLIKNLKIMD